jgi:N-acetylglucosamine-6-sulfatase
MSIRSGWAVAALLLMPVPGLGAPPPRDDATGAALQPHILLILTDDQRADAVGASGRFPFLETPHIDRLAAEGTSFENAFVTTSLCSPSRASILTGTYAHRHGVLSNDREDLFGSTLPAFPQLLREAGYETAFIGKWHMSERSDPRPGFDYWLSFSGQGVYSDPVLNENGRELREKGYITDILTEYAERWLERERDAPFALIVSHKASHHPFTPAPRHANAFADASLPRPGNYRDDLSGKPAWLRHIRLYGDARKAWSWRYDALPAALPDTEGWVGDRPLHLDYLRSLMAVDDSVGRILALLDARGELENTLVVFTSDNGYHLGEHRLTNKMLMYERSIHVPLVLRAPGRVPSGAKRQAIVTNLDIAPTLLEAAGLPIPESVQGRTLLPLARDAQAPGRDAFFYEYFGSPDLPAIPNHSGVRTASWKYIRGIDGGAPFEELYDLERDPEELTNLAADPAHAGTLTDMRVLWTREREASGYPDEAPRVGADESRWGWALEYCRREWVSVWRAFERWAISVLRPLKDWLIGSTVFDRGEAVFASRAGPWFLG